jgi:hypothetical protein
MSNLWDVALAMKTDSESIRLISPRAEPGSSQATSTLMENYESSAPQGWLARDHHDWVHSNQMIHSLQKITKVKMVFGHDLETFYNYKVTPEFYE